MGVREQGWFVVLWVSIYLGCHAHWPSASSLCVNHTAERLISNIIIAPPQGWLHQFVDLWDPYVFKTFIGLPLRQFQWLRINMMQGTQLGRSTCLGATKHVPRLLSPLAHVHWSPECLEPVLPQQEKPLQWEVCAAQVRVACSLLEESHIMKTQLMQQKCLCLKKKENKAVLKIPPQDKGKRRRISRYTGLLLLSNKAINGYVRDKGQDLVPILHEVHAYSALVSVSPLGNLFKHPDTSACSSVKWV